MFLTRLVIKRPVSATMFFIAVIIIAIYVFTKLPLSLYPELQYPRLTVVTSWSDAGSEKMEASITSKIEEISSTISGVRKISSFSYQMESVVNIEFFRGTNMALSRFELNEKLQLLEIYLPAGVKPCIKEYVPSEFRKSEFLQYGLSGPYYPDELEEILREYFIYPLSSLEGISALTIEGIREKIYRVLLKTPLPSGINMELILHHLKKAGYQQFFPAVEYYGTSCMIELRDDIEAVKDLAEIKIRTDLDHIYTLADIAEIDWIYEKPQKIMRYNTMPQITLTISSEAASNVMSLSRQVKEIVEKQKDLLPAGVEIVKLEDGSDLIRNNTQILYQRGIISLLIVFLVLLVFLKRIGSALLVIFTIVISTALTFILMFYLGIGLNMLSLAGLALGLGMMVDNAIVVYENIFRCQEKGLDEEQAILRGVEEVALPLAASTVTTVMVFAPFLYLRGDLKIFYLPFVYSVVISLLASLLVAFTFIPLLAARMTKIHQPASPLPEESNHANESFLRVIPLLLRYRWYLVIAIILLFLHALYTFIYKIEKSMSWTPPQEDYISIAISMPVGTDIIATDRIARMFENKASEQEGIISIKTHIWDRYSYIKIDFRDEFKSSPVPVMVREKLRAFAHNFANSRIWIGGFGPAFDGGVYSKANFSLVVCGYSYERLKHLTSDIATSMQQICAKIENVDTNATGWWKSEKLYEYRLVLDRLKMSDFRLKADSALQQIILKMENNYGKISRKISGKNVYLIVKDKNYEDFTVTDLLNTELYTETGANVKVSQIADLNKIEITPEIIREDKLYLRRINFDFRGSLEKGNDFVDELKVKYYLPDGFSFREEVNDLSGHEAQWHTVYLIAFAILLVYMSLASLFESLMYPIIILMAIPLAFIGVIYMFHLYDENFGPSARIGFILLTGIVVNNSIILVHRFNWLRRRGLTLIVAMQLGWHDRLRPVLMTSLTTIMALVPMLWASRIDEIDFWQLLSLSTIGGMVASTFFVLTFIPVCYYLFSTGEEKKSGIPDSTCI